ncbi:MAG: hypothetical protein JRI25_26950, partial [Deltaproteobacteria bacterium]|nr:hypothetical protein [Deltaproteobacteria bacterium]
GAVGLDPEALEPFVAGFGAPLLDDMSIEVRGDYAEVSVRTRGDTASLLGRATALLEKADWGSPSGFEGRLQGLSGALTPSEVSVAATLRREGADPSLRIDLHGSWPADAILEALVGSGLSGDAIAAYDNMLMPLPLRPVIGLGLCLFEGTTRYAIAFEQIYSKEESAALATGIGGAAELIGVSAPQRAFVARIHEILTPRRQNHTPVEVFLEPDRLVPEIAVHYPMIPAELVLSALHAIYKREDHGARLGSIAGLLQVQQDVVHRFSMVARDEEPPLLAFALQAEAPSAAQA